MNENDLFNAVKNLLINNGWGRRRVAKELQISERKANNIINKIRLEDKEIPVPVNHISVKKTLSDSIKEDIESGVWNTYDMSKKYLKTPVNMNNLIRKANGEYDPASDWIKKSAKGGIKLSILQNTLKIKNIDQAKDVLNKEFPGCFIIQIKEAEDTILVPVYDSKKDIECLNIDTTKKPFKYYCSPAGNYLLLQIDDNYGSEKICLPAFSDIHVGSSSHRPELFDSLIDYVDSLEGSLPLLLGDLTENISKGSVGSFADQYSTPNEQVIEVCKKLEKIAHKIPLYLEGNHEFRTERLSDFNQGRVISQLLKLPYFPERSIVDIYWRGIHKTISVTHRYGKHAYSPSQVESEVLKLKQFLPFHIDAWFSGHNHRSFTLPEESTQLVHGRGFEHTRWFILNNGSCVGRTGGYAEKFPPAPQNMVGLEIYESGKIKPIEVDILGI